MKCMFTSLLVVAQVCIATAQTYRHDPVIQEEVRKIKLNAKKHPATGVPTFLMSGIKVVGVCPDTSRLGFVQQGLINRKFGAVPDRSWGVFVQDFVTDAYKDIYVEPGVQLLWVIKDLRIGERSFALNEKAYVRLKATAYYSEDKQNYRFLTNFDTILIHNGFDVTDKHNRQIAEAIHLLYAACSDHIGLDTSGALATEADITSKARERFHAPILQDSAYTEGVYRNYQEFLANAPSITNFEVVIKRKKAQIYAKGADSSRTLVESPWGVCKKGELYKYNAEVLVAVERNGNAFLLSNYVEMSDRRNTAMFWLGLAGGLAGGLAADASTRMQLVKWVPYITKQQPEAVMLDTESGELMF